jgi:crotonobetainyl-CoA:carnitine CoA-transferase CaiB-like acyl-CoA transferase
VLGALEDPQAQAREAVIEIPHERFGTVRTPGSPVRVGDARRVPVRAPRLGEQTHACLNEICGYDAERIERLAAAGVFGSGPAAREAPAVRETQPVDGADVAAAAG